MDLDLGGGWSIRIRFGLEHRVFVSVWHNNNTMVADRIMTEAECKHLVDSFQRGIAS